MCVSSTMHDEDIPLPEMLYVLVSVLWVIRDVTAKHGGDRTIEASNLPVSLGMIRRREGV